MNRSSFTRRRWLASTGAAAAASLVVGSGESRAAAGPIAGKHPRLIVHKPDPAEMETPLDLLAEHVVTPIENLFVRNNQAPDWAKTLDPYPADKPWPIAFVGQLEYPRTVTLAELRDLPQVEHEMVLQCSGNGRKMFERSVPTKGSPWEYGAMGNVRFRGPTFRSICEKFDVRPAATAKFLTAEGADASTKSDYADFEHSLPLADVMERSILALELNGRTLPALHGGPVRLVTPGFYGTMHVKWLDRVRFEAVESANHHQVKRYRTPLKPMQPGSEFDYGLDNSEPNWNMRIKCVLFSPTSGMKSADGRIVLRGAAWNDGTAAIESVEYTLDGGRTWNRTELERPASRYAWHPFRTELKLPPGEHEIVCRAVDALGRTQPFDGAVDWNPAGYCWHGAERVRVTAGNAG